MSETKWTPGPWVLNEYDEHGGYDCMTGGIIVGRVTLDGADYGQGNWDEITPEQRAQMEADARLIAAAPDMAEALEKLIGWEDAIRAYIPNGGLTSALTAARSALAKARGPYCAGLKCLAARAFKSP